MATINGSTSSSNWTYKLEVDEISTNVENNTSQVRVRGYLGRPSGNGGYGYSGDYNYIVQIDDSSEHKRSDSRYQSEGAIAGGDWSSQALFDETFTIKHNTDGTKTIKVYAEMTTSNFSPSSATATGSVVLSQLHKAPNITSVSMSESNTQLSGLGVANDTIVQYLSNKKITINTSTYDNATIKNYSIYHNNVLIGTSATNEIAVNFSSVAELMDSGTGSVGLMVAVTDSLGGYSTKMFNFAVIKYTRPSIEFTSTNIRRKTGNGTVLTDNKVSLNFVGTCYKGNDVIGNANKPTVQYKIWNNTEPNYSTLTTPNIANVTIKDFEISNIEYTEVYDYKIKIYDVFTTTESSINLKSDKVPTGVSVWTEYKDRVDFIKITENKMNVALEPTILFDDTDGVNDNLTLTDTSENYKYLEVFGYVSVAGNTEYISQKVYEPNGKDFNLNAIIQTTDSYILWASAKGTITDDVITLSLNRVQTKTADMDSNCIYITRVLGYK